MRDRQKTPSQEVLWRRMASTAFVVAVWLSFGAGTRSVWAKASPECVAACATAATDCVGLRTQERDAALAVCTGTGRQLSRCKKNAKTQFKKAKRLCKGKEKRTCQSCCKGGGDAALCVVVPTTSTTTLSPGATTSTTLQSGEPAPCSEGVFRVLVGNRAPDGLSAVTSTFELPAACSDDVPLTLAPTHVIRLRMLGADGQPRTGPADLVSAFLDPRPAHPAGETLQVNDNPDAEGRVELPVRDGRYRVRVAPNPCTSLLAAKDLAPVTVAGADVDLGDVTLEPRALAHLSGRVTNAEVVAAGAEVRVEAAIQTFAGDNCIITAAAGQPGPDGSLSFDLQVPIGRILTSAYQVVTDERCSTSPFQNAHHGGYAYRVVDVAGDTTTELPLVRSVPVTGTLLMPDGSPAAGGGLIPFGIRTVAPREFYGTAVFAECPADASGRFTLSLVPGFTYTLEGGSPAQLLVPQLRPIQILLAGLEVTGPTDVGTLRLRDGCHVRGQAIGLSTSPHHTVTICESRSLPDGYCLPLCSQALVDPSGFFDFEVVPGL